MSGFVICGKVYATQKGTTHKDTTQKDTTQKDSTLDDDCYYMGDPPPPGRPEGRASRMPKGKGQGKGQAKGQGKGQAKGQAKGHGKGRAKGQAAAPGEDSRDVSGGDTDARGHPFGVGPVAAAPGEGGGIEWFEVGNEKCNIFPKAGTGTDWISSYAARQNNTDRDAGNQTMSLLSRAGSRKDYGTVGIMLATDPGNAVMSCLDQREKWVNHPNPGIAYNPDTNTRRFLPVEIALHYFHDLHEEIGKDIEHKLKEMLSWDYRMAPYLEEMDGEDFYGVFKERLNLTDADANAYARQHAIFVKCFDRTVQHAVAPTPDVMFSFAFCPNADPRWNDGREGSYYWTSDTPWYKFDSSDWSGTRHRTKSNRAIDSYPFFRLGVFNAIVASLRAMQLGGVKLVIFDAMGCIYRHGDWKNDLRAEIHLICLAALVELKPYVFREAVVPWYASAQAPVVDWESAMGMVDDRFLVNIKRGV